MKLSDLSFITAEQLSGLFTAIANARVPGLKVTTKKLLHAVAQNEEVAPDALMAKLNTLYREAYQYTRMEAEFVRWPDGKTYLSKVDVEMDVAGYASRYISIYNSTFDFDNGCIKNNTFPNISGGGREHGYDAEKQVQNLQWATNAAFELCKYINRNRMIITPEELKSKGWEIRISQVNAQT